MSRPVSAAASAAQSKTALRRRRLPSTSSSTTIPSSRRLLSASSSSPSTSTSTSSCAATWKDYLPRIVDNIPRRVPPGARDALEQASSGAGAAGSSSAEAPGSLPFAVDVGGAVDALRRLVFPESLAAPADLTLPVVVFGALAVGLALELATLALKALEGASGSEGGRGGSGSGGNGASSSSSSTSSSPSTPPIDAPIVPRPPSKPSPTPPTTPTRAQIERERERLRDRIVAERYRGLSWLAAATAMALFTAGLMSAPTALRP